MPTIPPQRPGPSRFSAVPPAGISDDYIVDPLAVVAEEASMSIATLRREIAAGRGPVLTWLSQRRCGVQRRHRRAWLDERTERLPAA